MQFWIICKHGQSSTLSITFISHMVIIGLPDIVSLNPSLSPFMSSPHLSYSDTNTIGMRLYLFRLKLLQLAVFLAFYVVASRSPSTSSYRSLPLSFYSSQAHHLPCLPLNTLTSALWSTSYCAFSRSLIVSSSVSRDLCTSIPLTKKPFLTIPYKSSIPYSYLLSNYYHLVDFINVFISVSHHENISSMRVSTRILFTIVVQTPKRICFKKKKKVSTKNKTKLIYWINKSIKACSNLGQTLSGLFNCLLTRLVSLGSIFYFQNVTGVVW